MIIVNLVESIANLTQMCVNLLHGHLYLNLPIYECGLHGDVEDVTMDDRGINTRINEENTITNRIYDAMKLNIRAMNLVDEELLEFENVKELKVNYCKLLREIPNKGLTYLNCNNCIWIHDIKYPETLTHLHIANTDMEDDVIEKCSNLQELNCNCTRIKHLSNLRKLDKLIINSGTSYGTGNLEYVRELDVTQIRFVSNHILENIEVLRTVGFSEFNAQIAKCKKVQRIHLRDVYMPNGNIIINGLQYLEEIDIKSYFAFSIIISNCPQLTDVNIKCNQIYECNINNCPKIE